MNRYEQVCFELKEKKQQLNELLENAPIELFVLNTKMLNLTKDIKHLQDEKNVLEEGMK